MNDQPFLPAASSLPSPQRVVTLNTNSPIKQETINQTLPQASAGANARTCSNGHAVAESDAQFCTACGVSLGLVITSTEPSSPRDLVSAVASESPARVVSQATGPAAPVPTITSNRSSVTSRQLTSTSLVCRSCSGGQSLPDETQVCTECRQLRPLSADYHVDLASFQWAFDGQAMAKLKTIGPLNSMAKKVSDQIGRRWIETTFNGIRTSSRQMPNVYKPAVHAARLLGVNKMPDVYVSGERPWDALTFGSDESAFIVIGSALVGSFRGPELGFLFAREMGHIRAGHALWKTVIRFLVGEHNPRSGLMKNGIVGLLDPGKWIEGAIEVPLLNWARQAEITADRAGLLALGHAGIARRVLLSWSLKSPMLYRFVNQQAWLEQQDEDAADEGIRLTEMVTSSTPYISRRLKLLAEYAEGREFQSARQRIGSIPANAPEATDQESLADPPDEPVSDRPAGKPYVSCPDCQQKIRIPVQEGKERLALRCPNSTCRRVIQLNLKPVPKQKQLERTIRNLQAIDD